MSKYLENAKKPQYSKVEDPWGYIELKDYFDGISGVPFQMAACSFLSNVEGMGDFLDQHIFFDFQGYLAIAVAGISEGKMFKPGTEEYECLKVNVKYFMTGKCDTWPMHKDDLCEMKNDCKEVMKVYGVK